MRESIIVTCALLALVVLVAGVLFVHWMSSGKIRRSPTATRREKNRRHINSLIACILAALGLSAIVYASSEVGAGTLLRGALAAVVILLARTVLVELGIRRQSGQSRTGAG